MFPHNINFACNPLTSFYADKSVDSSFLSAGVLKSVNLPTGGSWEMEYESHRLEEGPPIKKFEFKTVKYLNTGEGSPVDYPHVVEKTHQFLYDNKYKLKVSLRGLTSFNTNCISASSSNTAVEILDENGVRLWYYPYTNVAENNNNDGYENIEVLLSDLGCQSGETYTLKIYGRGGYNKALLCYAANVQLQDLQEIDYAPSDYLVGGLRLKKLSLNDPAENTNIQYNYSYKKPILIQVPNYVYHFNYSTFNEVFMGKFKYFFKPISETGPYESIFKL